MKNEKSASRNEKTVLSHSSNCSLRPSQTISPHGPNRKQHALRGDTAREIGLPLHEILAMTDLMRDSYAKGDFEGLRNSLFLLMTKSVSFASTLTALIDLENREAAPANFGNKLLDIEQPEESVREHTR
jgi:hypothetical protein